MGNDSRSTDAATQYAAAHEVHYVTKDLHTALELYRGIMTSYSDAPEAGYALAQIRNIVDSVVPKQELLDVQAELALAYIEKGRCT